MKTHKQRAEEIVKMTLGLLAMTRPETQQQSDMCVDLAIDLGAGLFAEFESELLESQRATAQALGDALNIRGK